MNNEQWNILIERLYAAEIAIKGFSTRIKLIEASLDKIEEREKKRL